MNTPNPLVPQGSLQQQAKQKVSLPMAVFTILSIHVVVLGLLLAQGCNPKGKNSTAGTDTGSSTNIATIGNDTSSNSLSSFPPMGATNASPFATSPTSNSTAVVVPPPVTNVGAPYSNPLPGSTVATGVGDTTARTAVEKPTVADSGVSEAGKDYVVQKGDTLGKIAKKNGIKLSALRKANPNVVPEKLKAGQKIVIPGGGKMADAGSTGTGVTGVTSGSSGVVADTGDAKSYKVKAGDTLTKIAKANGTTAKKIRALNSLTTDKIKVGQTLKIPAGGASAERVATAKADGSTPVTPLPDATLPSATTPASTSTNLAH